jgi:hypothetical protein
VDVTPAGRDDRDQSGTVAFYAALGRAFVVMCAVIPALFAIELIDQATGHDLDRQAGILTRRPTAGSRPGSSGRPAAILAAPAASSSAIWAPFHAWPR